MVVVLDDKRIGKLSSCWRCRQVEDRDVERRRPCWEEMRDFLMTRALGLPQISTDIRPYQCSTWQITHLWPGTATAPDLPKSVQGWQDHFVKLTYIEFGRIGQTLFPKSSFGARLRDMYVESGPDVLGQFSDWIRGNLFWPDLDLVPAASDLVHCGNFTWIHMMNIHCSRSPIYNDNKHWTNLMVEWIFTF